MATVTSLDVTKIEPRLKHPTIFTHFDALGAGEELIIENDHDPKPLYYELLGERGNIFTWEYLEKGPTWFVIKITRLAAGGDEETVGAIAARDIRKAEILKARGIDFCCGGNKTLKEASKEAGVNEVELKAALEAADKTPVSPSQDYDKWEPGFLIDYIVNTHHRYVKETLGSICAMAVKVAQRHGEEHPELKKLSRSLAHFADDLLAHLEKEEMELFPAIKDAFAKGADMASAATDSLRQRILMLQKEHSVAGEDLGFFRKLTGNYALPEDACNSYNYLFAKMKEFEDDLQRHIHLENNILFPKALKQVEAQAV